MLGWPVDWETIAGAKPQNNAPRYAAPREWTTSRESRKYQAAAVPARASVEMIAKVTAAPKSSVIGLSGMASASTEVLAIKLTPSGALSSAVNNGESP